VLNAFRHHGIGHRASARISAWSLVVLNAFRHHGIGHCLIVSQPSSLTLRAQRLPASWNRSRWPKSLYSHRRAVLNAFRHHGIGHKIDQSKRPRLRLVLNAFRHHGIGHTLTKDEIGLSYACSTPSGIMESVTAVT